MLYRLLNYKSIMPSIDQDLQLNIKQYGDIFLVIFNKVIDFNLYQLQSPASSYTYRRPYLYFTENLFYYLYTEVIDARYPILPKQYLPMMLRVIEKSMPLSRLIDPNFKGSMMFDLANILLNDLHNYISELNDRKVQGTLSIPSKDNTNYFNESLKDIWNILSKLIDSDNIEDPRKIQSEPPSRQEIVEHNEFNTEEFLNSLFKNFHINSPSESFENTDDLNNSSENNNQLTSPTISIVQITCSFDQPSSSNSNDDDVNKIKVKVRPRVVRKSLKNLTEDDRQNIPIVDPYTNRPGPPSINPQTQEIIYNDHNLNKIDD